MSEIQQKIFFFIYTFFLRFAYSQTRGWIFTLDSSKDVKSRKDVPFGGLNDVPLSFGGNPPPKKKLKFFGRE